MNPSSVASSEAPSSPFTPNSTLAPGMVVGRKYRIEAVLGSGAMGTVYRAQHLWLDAPIALKVLHPELLNHEGIVGRFLEEARAAACLHSENVVRVLDTGRTQEGVVFLALEYVTGRDLEYELRDEGRLPLEAAVRYALDVCGALAEAHGRGIVHRDIKPENLLLDRGAGGRTRVKVADFGVAKRFYSKRERSFTAASSPVGTPSYMAPEQILNAAEVDGRADIFSLGVVLYEMLTGYLPFGGDSTGETYAATLQEDPTPPRTLNPEIPLGLERIILRCLEKRREDRFPDVGELAVALAEYGSALDRAQAREAEQSLGATEVHWEETEGPQGRPSTTPPVEKILVSEIPGLERRWPVWLTCAALGAAGVVLFSSSAGREALEKFWYDERHTTSEQSFDDSAEEAASMREIARERAVTGWSPEARPVRGASAPRVTSDPHLSAPYGALSPSAASDASPEAMQASFASQGAAAAKPKGADAGSQEGAAQTSVPAGPQARAPVSRGARVAPTSSARTQGTPTRTQELEATDVELAEEIAPDVEEGEPAGVDADAAGELDEETSGEASR